MKINIAEEKHLFGERVTKDVVRTAHGVDGVYYIYKDNSFIVVDKNQNQDTGEIVE